MFEIVVHVHQFVPRFPLDPEISKHMNWADLLVFLLLIELPDCTEFTDVVVVAGMLGPPNVIEIAMHAG